ncbi:MAG: ABC transporter ATP-binding protein/permease [Spirochaetaceae bacterium]|nr:ABC transporter ATP-binding protein/permease [Spirochaetaceae bacterium]
MTAAVLPSFQTLAIAGLLDALPGALSSKSMMGTLGPLSVLFAVLLSNYFIQALNHFLMLKLNMHLEDRLKPALVMKINNLSYEHIENNETYDLIERVGEDIPAAVQSGFTNLLDLAEIIINILGLIVIIGRSSLLAAFFCLLLIVPVVIIARKSGNEAYQANAQIAPHARRAKYLKSLISSRESSSERTLFGFGEKINTYWNREMDRKIDLDYKTDKKIFVRSKSISIVFTLLLFVMALLLLWVVSQKKMTAGTYISLIISLSTLIHTLSWQLSEMLKEYTNKRLYIEDLERLNRLSEVSRSDLAPEKGIQEMPFESLVFDHVSFTYPQSEREVLHDFSLELYPGKRYAFVGRNGCGKSTVIKLLTGLYADYHGRILLNNRDINSFSAGERKAYCAVVYQDYAKYQLTLREQLKLGNPDLSDREIEALLEQMGLEHKIQSLPKGLDTSLGKLEADSFDFSEGQWQRLALARSFGRKAKLFIFDEPAASLDVLAENQLYETIRSFGTTRQMTTLYITHRLAAARLADEIIVMDEGRIVEQGTHAALLAKKAYYAEMFTTQRKWYQEKQVMEP